MPLEVYTTGAEVPRGKDTGAPFEQKEDRK